MLNKWIAVCGSDLQREHSGDGCLSSSILFKYESSRAWVRRVAMGGCCFGVIYGGWYDVCDFIVLSDVEICVDSGGVIGFHVCLDCCVVYCFGICVYVRGVRLDNNNNNNNNCLKSNIQCIEIRVQWTVHYLDAVCCVVL